MNIPLVFVYLGSLPSYGKISLRLAARNYRGPVVLLTDQQENPAIQGVETILIADWYDRSSFAALELNSPLDPGFRKGFWLKALERFFVLEAYCRHFRIERLFHAELDVLVLDLGGYSDLLDATGNGVFYPFGREDQAIASLFYSNEIESLRALCNYASQNAQLGNEMQILASFSKDNSEKCWVLPSEETVSEFSVRPKKLVNPGLGLVDGAIMGHRFFGQDPKNTRGFVWNHWRQREHAPIDTELRVRFEPFAFSLQALVSPEVWAPIRALHIHSKIFPLIQFRFVFLLLVLGSKLPFRIPLWISRKALAYQGLRILLAQRSFYRNLDHNSRFANFAKHKIADLVMKLVDNTETPMTDQMRERHLFLIGEQPEALADINLELAGQQSLDNSASTVKEFFSAARNRKSLKDAIEQETSLAKYILGRPGETTYIGGSALLSTSRYHSPPKGKAIIVLQAENDYELVRLFRGLWPGRIRDIPFRPSRSAQFIRHDILIEAFRTRGIGVESWEQLLTGLRSPSGALGFAYGLLQLSQSLRDCVLVSESTLHGFRLNN